MMHIETNKVVTLSYRLTNLLTGEHIEETNENNPLVFLYGVGSMLPDFEANLHALSAGSNFDFSIAADRAYGIPSEDEIVMIPKNVFCDENGTFDDTHFKVGTLVPMSDGQGHQLQGRILEIKEEEVTMDFNHPLAGTDLRFEGTILEVREATPEEIDHGHAHGPHGHSH
ncbi:MAG: peptidylprolyl isomerase [Flavobacteriia bacterium]|nr:peptidylprolyl isomerase [Flavobacteriia bacterium]